MLSSKNDKILPGWIGSQGTDFVERKALQKRINIMSIKSKVCLSF